MKKIIGVFLLAVSFLSFTPAIEKEMVENGSITVTINGIEEQKGQVVFMLFTSGDGFPKEVDKAYKKGIIKEFGTSATYTFKDIPYGKYAIAVFHDEDSNGEIKTNFIGFPKESVGASNMTKMGKPSFKKSAIELNQESTSISMEFIM